MPKKRLTEKDYKIDDRPLGYSQCEWIADGQRCRYPGSSSSNTKGHGPWYCTAHAGSLLLHDGPVVAAQIVERSMNYRHLTMEERDARYVRDVLKNPDYKPRLRGCEVRECVNPSRAREDGHYLCYLHRTLPATELGIRTQQPLPPKAADFMPPMREPGSDDGEMMA